MAQSGLNGCLMTKLELVRRLPGLCAGLARPAFAQESIFSLHMERRRCQMIQMNHSNELNPIKCVACLLLKILVVLPNDRQTRIGCVVICTLVTRVSLSLCCQNFGYCQ